VYPSQKPTPLFPIATVACFAEPNARSNKPRSKWDANSFSTVELQIGYWKGLYANVTFFCGVLGSKLGEIYVELIFELNENYVAYIVSTNQYLGFRYFITQDSV